MNLTQVLMFQEILLCCVICNLYVAFVLVSDSIS
jgi:hypothetical protein